MTIKEWLTPGVFDFNVILVALLINWTLINLASNYLEDFHIPERVQNANYTAVVLMSLAYGALILLGFTGVVKTDPTLYPNPYDFLLMGNYKALACIILGIAVGGPLGWFLGKSVKVRWIMTALAICCEALIAAGVLLWILAQQ